MTVRIVGAEFSGDMLVEVTSDGILVRCAASSGATCSLPDDAVGFEVEELFTLAASGRGPGPVDPATAGGGIDWSRIATLDPCLWVSFDEHYGYPRSIWHNCRDASGADAWGIGIVEFEELP